MKFDRRICAVAAIGLLDGCATPDSVLFVTDSSIGFNVDNKPPTVSIAYDRIEGYIAPRYENGALPPVVASIETGGSVFNPKIRQVYATGAAAVKAVGTRGAQDGPIVLSGDAAQKRLVFFGTTTTLGLKAGFSGDGYPDSLTFGYKRKEFSFIPLASMTTNGVKTDVYPAVLASIDTTITATSPKDTGLTSKQFFATGQAAETLARNPAVSGAFKKIADRAATGALTAEDQAKVEVYQQSIADDLTKIRSYFEKHGGYSESTRDSLLQASNLPPGLLAGLKQANTEEDFFKALNDDVTLVPKLAMSAK